MRIFIFTLVTSLMLTILACAQSVSTVAPEIGSERVTESYTRELWGLYDVSIDPDTLEVSVVPARTSQFRMNVNTFMNANPALLGIAIKDASNLKKTGEIKLDVSLTHPINKPKLAGFDVHCVLLSNATYWLNFDDSLTYPAEGFNPYLMNPDGWTRWYNAVEFTTPGLFGYVPGILGKLQNPQATLNGYKLYADGLGAKQDVAEFIIANKSNRNIFSPGATNTREWLLKFPLVGGKPVLLFQYAVVASWAKPSVSDPTPADFPPEANIAEAAHLRVDLSQSTLYYTPTKWGGNLVINLDVFDWQGGDNIKGEVKRIIVESSIFNHPILNSDPGMTQTPGNPYATYSVSLPADVLTSADDVGVWIGVESKSPNDYNNGVPAAYPVGKPLIAWTYAKAPVSDEAPVEPPVIISGVDIISGTTQCPDRNNDNQAVFGVVAQSSVPLTYKWSLMLTKGMFGEFVPGYQDLPGDGAGHFTVDFTEPVFKTVSEGIAVICSVSDGINDPVFAKNLYIYLDCLIFNADLDSLSGLDNMGWTVADMGMSGAYWKPVGGTDAGSMLNGKGALWQGDPDTGGGVPALSKGMLVSPPIRIPEFLSGAKIEFDHAYSFHPFTMGGNVKVGAAGTLTSVTMSFKPIASGHPYDGALEDTTNPMYPQSVFSASGVSGAYTSVVMVPGSLIGQIMQIGFAAAAGSTSIPDGGWLIDGVRVIGIL